VVKCKEYKSISILYIYGNHEDIIHSIYVKQVIEQWEPSKNRAFTTWGADWDYFGAANHVIITLYPSPCVKNLILWVGYKNDSCIREIQENSIKSSLQNSLSYILLQMVCAYYCAPYPKWPCVKHEANMWCPCCMTSFYSRTFYFLLYSLMINIVTTSSEVTDVTNHF